MGESMDGKKLYYQSVITVWENFCELHRNLYDLACDEYLTLLASDIEKLETMLPVKEEIIAKIGELEKTRAELIERLNESGLFATKIEKASDLLKAFEPIEAQAPIHALKNLNTLLIDIIHKIQDQNKKNQVFLNKAMLSLREMKHGFNGKKTFTTYGADGQTRSLNR